MWSTFCRVATAGRIRTPNWRTGSRLCRLAISCHRADNQPNILRHTKKRKWGESSGNDWMLNQRWTDENIFQSLFASPQKTHSSWSCYLICPSHFPVWQIWCHFQASLVLFLLAAEKQSQSVEPELTCLKDTKITHLFTTTNVGTDLWTVLVIELV